MKLILVGELPAVALLGLGVSMLGFVELVLDSPQLELLLLGHLLKLSSSVRRFHEIVVDGPHPCLLITILTRSVVVEVLKLGDFVLVLGLFFMEAFGLVLQVVYFLSERESLIAFLGG